jgi:hypothetical protein
MTREQLEALMNYIQKTAWYAANQTKDHHDRLHKAESAVWEAFKDVPHE